MRHRLYVLVVRECAGGNMREVRDGNVGQGRPVQRRTEMNQAEAQAEAVRRWGKKGAIDALDLSMLVTLYEGPFMVFLVGIRQDELTFIPKGIGQSKESAFADADRREQQKKEG